MVTSHRANLPYVTAPGTHRQARFSVSNGRARARLIVAVTAASIADAAASRAGRWGAMSAYLTKTDPCFILVHTSLNA
jgi:hypothetical protein